jgi:hypothetical protein
MSPLITRLHNFLYFSGLIKFYAADNDTNFAEIKDATTIYSCQQLHDYTTFFTGNKHKTMMPWADQIQQSKGSSWKIYISDSRRLELSCEYYKAPNKD